MRLICPNCDAEYEVDAALIPEGGRDVQCSNCGHAWFQAPPEELAARAEEQALYGDAPDEPPAAVPSPPPAAVASPPPASTPWAEDEDDAPEPAATSVGAPAAPPSPGRSLDESLLAVLREEAERERAARKAEAAPLETQTEMGLDGTAPRAFMAGPPAAVQKKIALLRGEPEPSEKADLNRPRRELLPEIDEINSSLRAAGERREVDQGAVADTLEPEAPRASGFRRGFLTVMIVAILAATLYIAAPILAAKVPATAGAMAAYVHAIDALRTGLDALARGFTARLSGWTGGQG
jgi:predicted Zn finger-like uncharacterized protein